MRSIGFLGLLVVSSLAWAGGTQEETKIMHPLVECKILRQVDGKWQEESTVTLKEGDAESRVIVPVGAPQRIDPGSPPVALDTMVDGKKVTAYKKPPATIVDDKTKYEINVTLRRAKKGDAEAVDVVATPKKLNPPAEMQLYDNSKGNDCLPRSTGLAGREIRAQLVDDTTPKSTERKKSSCVGATLTGSASVFSVIGDFTEDSGTYYYGQRALSEDVHQVRADCTLTRNPKRDDPKYRRGPPEESKSASDSRASPAK